MQSHRGSEGPQSRSLRLWYQSLKQVLIQGFCEGTVDVVITYNQWTLNKTEACWVSFIRSVRAPDRKAEIVQRRGDSASSRALPPPEPLAYEAPWIPTRPFIRSRVPEEACARTCVPYRLCFSASTPRSFPHGDVQPRGPSGIRSPACTFSVRLLGRRHRRSGFKSYLKSARGHLVIDSTPRCLLMTVRYFQTDVSPSSGSTSAIVPENLEMPKEHMGGVFQAVAQRSEQVIYRKGMVTKHFRCPLYHQNQNFRQGTSITF